MNNSTSAVQSETPAKRRPSFGFKLPELDKAEKKKKETNEAAVQSRPDKPEVLDQTQASTPEQTSEPTTSPRDSAKSKSRKTIPGGAGKRIDNSLTTTTTTTSTASTTTTTSTTTLGTAPTAATSSTESPNADKTSEPRPHWLHYYTGESLGYRPLIGRGKERRLQLELLLKSLKENPDQLFRQNASKPTGWIKEFRLVSTHLWSDVIKSLQVESKKPDVEASWDAPASQMERLEKSFSAILKTWAGQGQEAFMQSLTPEIKAMAVELLECIRQSQQSLAKKSPEAVFQDLISDLLVFSLIEQPDAPDPLTKLFGSYLAGFLGRNPTHAFLFRQDGNALGRRITEWKTHEAASYYQFDPADALLKSAMVRPLQKFSWSRNSDEFYERSKGPMKVATDFRSVFTNGAASGDKRFSPPFRREFAGENNVFRMRKGDSIVDITKDYDALHGLLNEYLAQGVLAQACCTQHFNQGALRMVLGDFGVLSPFKDVLNRVVSPKLSALAPTWTIERKPTDDALEISLGAYLYFEQIELVSGADNASNTTVRALLPGWLEIEAVVTVAPSCVVDLQSFGARAWNLHLSEGMPDALDLPDEVAKSSTRSTLKKLKRLSMTGLAPLGFGNEDKDREKEKTKARPKDKAADTLSSPPSSPRTGAAGKEGSPKEKELPLLPPLPASPPKPREKEKD